MKAQQAAAIAAGTGWLASTPPAFQEAVLSRCVLRRFESRKALYLAGDEAGGMVGIVEGAARLMLSAGDHGPYFAHILRPGQWIGEGPSVSGHPRLVSLLASGRVWALFLSSAMMREVVHEETSHWRFFMQGMTQNLEIVLAAIADMMLHEQSKRLIAILLRLGGCRRPGSDPVGPIDVDVSQGDLAVMAAVSRTTARETLRKLEEGGTIATRYGRVRIIAPARLRAMVAE